MKRMVLNAVATASDLMSFLAALASEDLEQDEEPAADADNESNPRVDDQGLTEVTEHKHEHSADQQTEEHAGAKVGLDGLQDQEELNHLQGHGEGPVNVAVHDRAHVDGHPELAHVEVVHCRDQRDKSTHVHGRLPVR